MLNGRNTITTNEKKSIQIEIMKSVHDWCQKNEITYYLIYGSLLGAVRHHGFIPWDDDIDIAMPRDHYKRFLNQYSDQDGKFEAVSIYSNNLYNLSIGKVIDKRTILREKCSECIELGVNIDVFPLDVLPVNYKRSVRYWELTFLRRIWGLKQYDIEEGIPYAKREIVRIIKKMTKNVSCRIIAEKIDLLAQKITSKKSNNTLLGSIALGVYGDKEIWEKKCFSNRIKMRFEEFDFYVPEEYDAILRMTYGDYMKLPPEDQRISHHSNLAYWR